MTEPYSEGGGRFQLPISREEVGNLATDRNARDREVGAVAEVGLKKHTDGVPAVFFSKSPRGRPVAPLEPVQTHAGTAAHIALSDRPRRRAVKRRKHVLFSHMKTVDVV